MGRKIEIPGIGKIGSIEDVPIGILQNFANGVISGSIVDMAEEVVYSLKVEGEKKIKDAKVDGVWARKTTERYAGKILSNPNTIVTLDKKSFGSPYFRQRSDDGYTEALYIIKSWKDESSSTEGPPLE